LAQHAPGQFDAAKLRAARTAAGLTQADLAGRIGTDQTVVNSWESRGVRPSARSLGRICQALGLAVADLYRPDSQVAGTLADLRAAAGLSQSELARRLQVSQTRVSRWELAKSAPTWDEVGAYSAALDLPRTAIAAAIDLTVQKRGQPLAPRKPPRGAQFRLTNDSPHVIYELEDPRGPATVFSPQFPRLAYRTKSPTPSMLEIATLNEHVEASYLQRYNHLQRRCADPVNGGPVYLIRWLSAYHENSTPAKHLRGQVASELIDRTHLWRSDSEPAPRHPLSTGEYLVIVVEPNDTVGFLFSQLVDDEPAVFFPTRFEGGIGSLVICRSDSDRSEGEWRGQISRNPLRGDITYTELFQHLKSTDSGANDDELSRGTRPAETAAPPQDAGIVHSRFGKTTPYD
jgi:transcriptional regulator with XRE-family HTH domain